MISLADLNITCCCQFVADLLFWATLYYSVYTPKLSLSTDRLQWSVRQRFIQTKSMRRRLQNLRSSALTIN